MGSIKSIMLILISILFSFFLVLEVSASNTFSGLETKITIDSNSTKIKKMQLALTDFGLYSGKIDGNYKSVKSSLLDYQKSTGLIVNDYDYGAGYFGIHTLTALREDFPNKFNKVTEKYLKMDKPATNIRNFYITAYYSPLPNQKRYSYNVYKKRYRTFTEEKKLQGEGKITASGKKVFAGILAAPRNYNYGTKIEFEGLGVGVVEDRGGAIVNSGERGHEYDRIDIWMGYGDEGLRRALKWGKRTVKGKIVPNTRELSIQFDTSVVSKYNKLSVNAEHPKTENIIKLQKLLSDIKLYNGKIDGNFNKVKNILIKYQVNNNIIISKNSNDAGYFGQKTYVALKDDFGGDIFKNRNNELDEDVILSKDIRDKLDKIHIMISAVIDNKYGKNTIRAINYRKNLRYIINKKTKKINNELRKRQLKYLKSLI